MRRQRGGRFPLGCLSFGKTRQLGRKKNSFPRQKFSADLLPRPVSLLITAPPPAFITADSQHSSLEDLAVGERRDERSFSSFCGP